MDICRPLAEYAWLVERIRKNRKAGMEIGEAVDKAIDDMPVDYLIRMFLIGNRAEVKDMCITEYNEAETMKMFRPLRTISCAKWQNNGIAVLLSEQWAGIVAEPGREGRLCAVRVQICQTFR